MFSIRSKHIYTDETLLEGFNQRDEAAFCHIYEKYYNELVYFTRKLLTSENGIHAQDWVQDLFLTIWESQKQFESLEILKSYLYLSLRNKWKNHLEHESYVRKYNESQKTHPTDDYVLASIVESETLALFHRQINSLPPACAQVIRLGLQGLSGQEIAEKLQLSIHTVYSHKQKALQLLRDLLPQDMFHLLFFLVRKI